jgi:hypothetical protein
MQANSDCKPKDCQRNWKAMQYRLFALRKGIHSRSEWATLQSHNDRVTGRQKSPRKTGAVRKHSPRRANHFATRTGYHNQWPIPIKIHSGRRRGLGNNVFTLFRRGRQMRLPHQWPCMWPNRWSIRVHKSDRLKSFPSRCCLSSQNRRGLSQCFPVGDEKWNDPPLGDGSGISIY